MIPLKKELASDVTVFQKFGSAVVVVDSGSIVDCARSEVQLAPLDTSLVDDSVGKPLVMVDSVLEDSV